MTEVSVEWENEKEEKEKKPIKFVKYLDSNGLIQASTATPDEYTNVMLISQRRDWKFDVMVAWDKRDSPGNTMVYFGYWNDGVVE